MLFPGLFGLAFGLVVFGGILTLIANADAGETPEAPRYARYGRALLLAGCIVAVACTVVLAVRLR